MLARAPSSALVLGAMVSVQFGSAIATTVFDRVGPSGAVLLRLVSASIVLLIIWRPKLRSWKARDLLLPSAFGVVLAAMNLCFYHSIQRIPLGIAVTIEFVGPLAVAVAGSRRRRDLVWVGLAVAGILALTHGDTHTLDMLGVILALIAGGLWGLYIVLNARMGQAFTGGSALCLSMCVASIVSLPMGIGEGGLRLLAPHTLAIGAIVGVLSSAIPYSLEMEALRRIATSLFGVLMSLEPATAAFVGFLVLGQALSTREIAGIALVVLASIGASRTARKAPIEL